MTCETHLNKVIYYNPVSEEAGELELFVQHQTTTIEFDIFCSRLEDYELDRDTSGGLHVLHIAVCQQNPELVQHIVENGGKAFINAGTFRGVTPLKMAISTLNSQVTEQLLDLDANVNDRGDEQRFEVERGSPHFETRRRDNYSPLYHAAEIVKNLALVKILLRYQARTDIELSTDAQALVQLGKNELESEKGVLITKLKGGLSMPFDLIGLIADYFICVFRDAR